MSEKEESLSVGKNFSRREWLMLIVILLLAEAGALIASHSFMANQDVINYISFASTIASLLLAVLAIVYGFYQSESQKRTGDGIESHMRSLKKASQSIELVSKKLYEKTESMRDFSQNLMGLNNAIEATQLKINGLEGSVNNLHVEQAKTKELFISAMKPNAGAHNEGGAAFDIDFASKVLLNVRTTRLAPVLLYCLNQIYSDNASMRFNASDFLKFVANYLAGKKFLNMGVLEWSSALAVIMTFVDVVRAVELRQNESGYEMIFDGEAGGFFEKGADIVKQIPGFMEISNDLKEGLQSQDFTFGNKTPT